VAPGESNGGKSMTMIPFAPRIPSPRIVLRILFTVLCALAAESAIAANTAADTVADKAPARARATSYSMRPDVRAFIDEMVSEHGYDRAALKRAFASARYQPEVFTAMQRPLLEPPKWYDYAPPFLSPARIDEIGRAHV